MTTYSKQDGTVYGRITKTKDKTYIAAWVCPRGYFSEGNDVYIGEYSDKNIAETEMKKWIENKWEEQRKAKEKINKP